MAEVVQRVLNSIGDFEWLLSPDLLECRVSFSSFTTSSSTGRRSSSSSSSNSSSSSSSSSRSSSSCCCCEPWSWCVSESGSHIDQPCFHVWWFTVSFFLERQCLPLSSCPPEHRTRWPKALECQSLHVETVVTFQTKRRNDCNRPLHSLGRLQCWAPGTAI